MPLLRRVARVAAAGAVAGGAAGAVQHRQQGRWARQEEEQRAAQEQQQMAAAPPPPEENSMEKLKERFPPGLEYRIVFDTTGFTRDSIRAVLETLAEAMMLAAMDHRHRLQAIRPSTAGKSATSANLLEAHRKLRKHGRRRALCISASAQADAG